MTEENKVPASSNTKDITFEDAMEKLEKIVKQLEENEVPLEEAIDLFQEGITLSKLCHQRLEKVEEKMDQIIEKDGGMKPFNIQEDDMA
ncbi:exodeoxyribonuclease VII small subunit [Scopulibacillus darangshiensis]|uniref:Exodeoxyribonuclease 7 small subunit n=1 Tax=Scopulibacillus darangshiensis TaxID=442528 RepID=A0A4R2P8L7_9BACL|nr:exodeoxyribonuclease VII small subunit [Scopulibacillus darangshiensis]TCP31187.1 exodeoxyribonuclease VII small subunit [Scopulibacillus darangshiensis]